MANVVTPTAIDMDGLSPALQRCIIELCQAVNGGTEGADVVGGLSSNLGNVTQTQQRIIAGTQTIHVTLEGRGDLASELDALQSNSQAAYEEAQAATGGLVLTVDRTSVYGEGASGTITTANSVTVSVSGGVAPYFISWAKDSGADVTAVSPAAFTTFFQATPPDGFTFGSVQCATVTDSTPGTPLEKEICITATVKNTTTGGELP